MKQECQQLPLLSSSETKLFGDGVYKISESHVTMFMSVTSVPYVYSFNKDLLN
jgi:hypothetical protein